jgi:hypothetical protein
MQTDAPVRKAGGRLSREDQRRLGDILQRVYDDVLRQGVPDRFRHLLDELESGKKIGQSEASTAGHGTGEHNSVAERVAKGPDNPGSKESH